MPPNLHDLQPRSVDGAALFDDIERRVTRYVFIGEHERAAVVAFIAHCHTIEKFYTTPRIKITSPEENCGKSLLAVDIMGSLLPAGSILSVSITPAALYRKLAAATPAFVLDEFDNTLGRKGVVDSETQSTLLAVLNSGYRRGASVSRCVPPSYEPVDFPTFAPVVVAGIRPSLSKAFETRTIAIEMQRPLSGEYPEVFEHTRETVEESEQLQGRIAEWAEQNLDTVGTTRPERPDGLVGRTAECWMPLLTVAEVAGGNWPDRVRAAAKELGLNGRVEAEGSYSHELLADTREVFGDRDHIHTADLLDGLNGLEERRWAGWNNGEGIRPTDFVHRVIKHYGLPHSKDIRVGETVRKGYERAGFEDAWSRFCSPSPPDPPKKEPLTRYTATTVTPQGNQPISDPLHDGEPWDPEPLRDKGCSGVAANAPQVGATGDTTPSCSRFGTTEATYLVPAHWDPALKFCSACCQKLDEAGEIPPGPVDVPDAVDDPEKLLQRELGATFVAEWARDEPPPSSWLRAPVRAVDPRAGVTVEPGGPADWVHLGAEGLPYGYRDANGKKRTTTLKHVWAVCDKCGERVMRKKGDGPKRCVITPGCEGTHRP